MATRLGQYCINVSNLEKATDFYENAIGLKVTNRIEEEKFREVILGTEDGARLQLAFHKEGSGPIVPGNAFWKHYVYTDDCKAVYESAVAAGADVFIGIALAGVDSGEDRKQQLVCLG